MDDDNNIPWHEKRSREFDPFASKHSGGRRLSNGRQGRAPGRKSHEARVARAKTNNWPRGRS